MSRIFAIGEIVYDIIFKNNQPQQANPGGSMLNSAISLSRIGLPVFLLEKRVTMLSGQLFVTSFSQTIYIPII